MVRWGLRLYFLILFQLYVTCSKNSSLTFVIDDTYSMYSDINQVIQAAGDIMDNVIRVKESEIEDVVLVTFNDPSFLPRKKTSNKTELITALKRIKVHGGGDCPEYALSGVKLALQESRHGSYLYVFTDATDKDRHLLKEVKNLCVKKESQVNFIITHDDCDLTPHQPSYYNSYYEIAQASSGQVYIVDKDQVNDVVQLIKFTLNDKKSVIKTKYLPPSNTMTAVPFTVDDKIEYTIISATGLNVVLYVTSKNGIAMAIEQMLWLASGKVAKFYAPNPGTYYAWVKGNTQVSIVVYARTDFAFDHGFSKFVPKSLDDTSTLPIANQEHYLSISVTDSENAVDIISAEILNMDDKVENELPLKKSSSGNFYITEPFISPSTMFKLQVTGKVKKTGRNISRISKTAIEPQAPPPPASKPITTDITEGSIVDVDYDGEISLTCHVFGYPTPEIEWVSKDKVLISRESHVLEPPYKYISYLKLKNVRSTETYYCQAFNRETSQFSTVTVKPRSPFRVYSSPTEPTQVKYGERKKLICSISSSHPFDIKWSTPLKSSDFILSDDKKVLTIKQANITAQGTYTCEATLKSDPKQKISTSINVELSNLEAPKIIYSNNSVTVMDGQKLLITCKSTGVPTPVVTWRVKAKNSDTFDTKQVIGQDYVNSQISYAWAGSYECTAANVIGTKNSTIEVIVHGAPEITNADSVYIGVTGDMVLKIPCEVTGVPEPVITWKHGNKVVTSDAKLTVDKNSIVINNPKESDSSNFICEARNVYGHATKKFTVTISDYLINRDEELNTNIYLKPGESKNIKCLLSHSDPQSIRWYVNDVYTNVHGPIYFIRDAKYENDGNYTCRRNTNQGSESLNYVVDVGYKPSFKLVLSPIYTWNGNKEETLDCDVHAKPNANIEWFFNGKPLDYNGVDIAISDWGTYSCNVSNVHGSVQHTYNVTSDGCLINRTADRIRNTPLIIGDEPSTWPQFSQEFEFYTVSQNQEITLECSTQDQPQNTFKNLPNAKIIKAECFNKNLFIVDKKTYEFENLQCKEYVKASQVLKNNTCMHTGKTVEIGFKLNSGFLGVYEACYNNANHKILFTKVLMSYINVGNIVKSSFKLNEGIKTGKAHGDIKKCQYNKRWFVNPVDVAFGPAQTSTLLDKFNAVSVYEPCDGSSRMSWSDIENAVQHLLFTITPLTTWTGASNYNSQGIPRYLWKVVKINDDTFEAIVYVNAPDADTNFMCEPNGFKGIVENSDQYTYSCTIKDFMKAFNVPNRDFGITF